MAGKSTKFLTRIKDLRMVIKASKPGSPGKEVKFNGMTFETDDKEIIERIKKSRMFGIDIFEDKVEEVKTKPIASDKKPKTETGENGDENKNKNLKAEGAGS